MPSLTPLHETYCKWDQTPPSQADVLEGIAQLMSAPINDVVREIILSIQHEMAVNVLGIGSNKAQQLQKKSYIQKFHRLSFNSLQHYGHYLVAPGLRHIIDKFPNLHEKPLSSNQHLLLGALNGVLGDYLLEKHNPIGLPMTIYDHYGTLQHGELTGHIILFIHGLCMTHLDWSHHPNGDIGEKLLAQRDHNTMLYLNYNTGRRISANGHSLSITLENLILKNPDITSISLIGHSMGGLVARSALFYGKQNVHQWIHCVENLVCIGSPHHGAMLERFGFNIQEKLGRLPIIKILGQLVNIRSNGILDLRYGSVRDDDWEHNNARIGAVDDNRKPAPLPTYINTFFIAGTIEHKNKNNPTRKALGDYLVGVNSALGEHPDPRFHLKVPSSHKAIFYGLNHLEIQYHPYIAEQIARWFYPPVHEINQDAIREYTIDSKLFNHFNLIAHSS
jgi:pimeloyl-ACP methyl ester carboxylesterase